MDWEKVGEAVNRGQALSHYWELFQEGLPVGAPLRLVPYVSFWREYKDGFRRFPWSSTGPILPAPVAKRIIRGAVRGWDIGTQSLNILIAGPTGVGKNHLASALGVAACLQGFPALFFPLNRLLEKLALPRAQ